MATSSIYQSPWATSKHTLPVLFIHKIMYKTIQIDTESLSKYLFLFHELTYRSDPSTDFHAGWLKRRGLAQLCAFLGFR